MNKTVAANEGEERLSIMLILSRFYQVDRQRPQMNADLAARRQAK